MEALFVGILGKAVIHVGPFIVLSFSGMKQIDCRVGAHSAQCLAPQFRMLFLIGCRVLEYRRYLLETVLAGHRCEIGVFVTSHALTRKCLLKVFLGFSA